MSTFSQPLSASVEALIQQAVDGSLDAFNQLVLSYQNQAYNQAYALLGDQFSAEDVTQESFIKAFQGIKKFRGGSFRAWLLRIVTNTAYDHLRQSRRYTTVPLFQEDENGDEIESLAWLVDPAPSVQSLVEHNELSQTLYRLVGELPETYRSVITLVDLNELEYAEAASALGVPIGTVKSRLARARLMMKDKLQDVFDAPKKIDAKQERLREEGNLASRKASSSGRRNPGQAAFREMNCLAASPAAAC